MRERAELEVRYGYENIIIIFGEIICISLMINGFNVLIFERI